MKKNHYKHMTEYTASKGKVLSYSTNGETIKGNRICFPNNIAPENVEEVDEESIIENASNISIDSKDIDKEIKRLEKELIELKNLKRKSIKKNQGEGVAYAR